ncbi:hypothetical protein ACHAXN_007948 [Cyclotella atomus]
MTQAIAWDPTAPFSLSLCPLPTASSDSTNNVPEEKVDQDPTNKATPLSILLSHDGTGIHPIETTCLLSLLESRDAYLQSKEKDATALSIRYRRSLCECLMELQPHPNPNTTDMDTKDHNVDNYESLALIYAMMHLTEIYLLPTKKNGRRIVDKLDDMAGSLTANTIRYLRTHHCSYDVNSPAVVELLEMDQPEYYVPSTIIDEPLFVGPFREPYYNLVLHLINLGQLSNAWGVLTRHSSCRRAEEEALRGEAISKEGEGWSLLRAILLSAPLPGGRGEEDDSGLVGEDEEDGDDGEEVDLEANDLLMPEVPRSSYCLWEAHPKAANLQRAERLRNKCLGLGVDPLAEDVQVYPEVYSENVALNVFYAWQRTAKSHMVPNRIGGYQCGALFTRFPQLEQICGVLLGHTISSGDWAEMLISELVYSRPSINPADIAIRARVHMTSCGVVDGVQESMVLKVMEGNAAEVISSMFSFGGASGAALPAVLVRSKSRSGDFFMYQTDLVCGCNLQTSLISNLLIDSGVMALPVLETEILLSAAEAILSSFSIRGQADVGVRTAVRLLLPHSPPKRIGEEICYEPRIAAIIYETISHRFPQSDAEALGLLNLCEEMINRGSARIADACESLAFCRATQHASNRNASKCMYWLMRGIEVMTVWLPEDYRRSLGFACRRHFDALCEESADGLLSCLAAVSRSNGDDQEKLTRTTGLALNRASTVLQAVLDDDSMTTPLKDSVEVALLYHIVEIANEQAESNNEKVAAHIVSCLEEQPSGGAAITLANSKMYFKLLQIAASILSEEEKTSDDSMSSASCAFTSSGLHILMVMFWEGKTSEHTDYFAAVQLMLCKGLMRALATAGSQVEVKQAARVLSLEDEVALMLGASV